MSEKEKQWKGDFVVKSSNILMTIRIVILMTTFYQVKLGFCICFFNCQFCKCGQLSHNYTKHDIGNPGFSCTAIVIPLFSWTTSAVYIFKVRLSIVHLKNLRVHIFIQIHILTPQESCWREISKFVNWFHGRNSISPWDF